MICILVISKIYDLKFEAQLQDLGGVGVGALPHALYPRNTNL
jgi:hypothetical protein